MFLSTVAARFLLIYEVHFATTKLGCF